MSFDWTVTSCGDALTTPPGSAARRLGSGGHTEPSHRLSAADQRLSGSSTQGGVA